MSKNTNQKPSKKKKKGFLRYLNPRNLATEVSSYGYEFSLKKFWKFYLLAIAAITGVCFVYKLHWPFILIVVGSCLLMSPAVILTNYRQMYEQQRFNDVSMYMEQMMYSFKRSTKILTALQDVLAIFPDGKMHEYTQNAIHYIQYAQTSGNIYKEAFAEIEADFDCHRVRAMHDFMIKVETRGGVLGKSMDILLEDRLMWVERVFSLLRERKNQKTKLLISIVLAFLICGTAMFMLPKEMGIMDMLISQISTTVFMVLTAAVWIFAQRKLTRNLLVDESDLSDEDLQRYYNRCTTFDKKKETKNTILKLLICVPILVAVLYLKQTFIAILIALVMLYLCIQPKMLFNSAKKKITREIEKKFPNWLMEVALSLQTNNVQISLFQNVKSAPAVLRPELEKMVDGIEKNPNSIKPYIDFLKDFDVPDIHSAMKMLYSVAELGGEDVEEQINAMIQRNHKMMDKAERLSDEDSLAGIGVLVLVPMLTGTLKMIVDLGLLIITLMSMTAIAG